jgi:hypothetical protein
VEANGGLESLVCQTILLLLSFREIFQRVRTLGQGLQALVDLEEMILIPLAPMHEDPLGTWKHRSEQPQKNYLLLLEDSLEHREDWISHQWYPKHEHPPHISRKESAQPHNIYPSLQHSCPPFEEVELQRDHV